MTKFTGNYQGKLRTETTHLQSGNALTTDAPTDNNGRGETFSPTDLVATALATCMATIMGIQAEKESLSIEGLSWQIEKHMRSAPRSIAKIKIEFTLPNSQLNVQQKEWLLKKAKNCPVALSLADEVEQEISFNTAPAARA